MLLQDAIMLHEDAIMLLQDAIMLHEDAIMLLEDTIIFKRHIIRKSWWVMNRRSQQKDVEQVFVNGRIWCNHFH